MITLILFWLKYSSFSILQRLNSKIMYSLEATAFSVRMEKLLRILVLFLFFHQLRPRVQRYISKGHINFSIGALRIPTYYAWLVAHGTLTFIFLFSPSLCRMNFRQESKINIIFAFHIVTVPQLQQIVFHKD